MKRFRIAFSFAGEKRDFVAKVAAILAQRFGKDKILYDKYHEAEFARHDLGIYLPKLYGEQSDLRYSAGTTTKSAGPAGNGSTSTVCSPRPTATASCRAGSISRKPMG